MKLVTAKQMQGIDSAAIDGRGIPGIDLMEAAGLGTAEFGREMIGGSVNGDRILIFCGKGNNGGDGFVVGRYLHEWGAAVEIYLFGKSAELKGDARENYLRIKELKISFTEILDEARIPEMDGADLIVDAIFGTGFRGEIRGIIATCVDRINSSDVPILAIDAPSGIDCDTGEVSGACIFATGTATMALPKLGQFLYPAREHVGDLKIIDIGIPEDIIESAAISLNLIDEAYVQNRLPRRAPTAHKGSCGKLLVLAGARGFTGAACMAAESSIRSGVGLCYLGIPASLNDICEMKLSEVITRPLPDVKRKGCFALRGLGEIRKEFEAMDAAAIGPGIGQHHETKEMINRLLPGIRIPFVLDADGLNALQESPERLAECDAPLVITPHPGELSRLMEAEIPVIAMHRDVFAREAASKFDCTVLLKGAPTFISDPSGEVYLNPTGNAGMATGGSGDILTGIIGAFLAQGLNPTEAACCGAYMHGFAADIAVEDTGETGLIPTDIIACLPSAFRTLGF